MGPLLYKVFLILVFDQSLNWYLTNVLLTSAARAADSPKHTEEYPQEEPDEFNKFEKGNEYNSLGSKKH